MKKTVSNSIWCVLNYVEEYMSKDIQRLSLRGGITFQCVLMCLNRGEKPCRSYMQFISNLALFFVGDIGDWSQVLKTDLVYIPSTDAPSGSGQTNQPQRLNNKTRMHFSYYENQEGKRTS